MVFGDALLLSIAPRVGVSTNAIALKYATASPALDLLRINAPN